MDKKRILAKIDELEIYLSELDGIEPSNFEEYKESVEKRRACERLLQISIETVIDICNIFISSLKLGLPSNEEEVIDKLGYKKIVSEEMVEILKNIKGFRNILVHKYGTVNDELVFEMIKERLGDFDRFKEEIIKNLR